MITKFNHVAIVVPDLNAAKQKYKEVLEKDYFVKYSPLIDPTKYMSGKYLKENIKLPSIVDTSAIPIGMPG